MKSWGAWLVCVLVAGSAAAGQIDKTVSFAVDQWVELEATDGPVTIHRVMVESLKDRSPKSAIFRPGNTEYIKDVRILVEYSNGTKKTDWKADLDIAWLDGSGEEIDGYNDDETLNEDERREIVTVTLSTLKYGLAHAKKLKIHIDFRPE